MKRGILLPSCSSGTTLRAARSRSVRWLGIVVAMLPSLCVSAERLAAAPGQWQLRIALTMSVAGAARLQEQSREMQQQLRRDRDAQPPAQADEEVARESI